MKIQSHDREFPYLHYDGYYEEGSE